MRRAIDLSNASLQVPHPRLRPHIHPHEQPLPSLQRDLTSQYWTLGCLPWTYGEYSLEAPPPVPRGYGLPILALPSCINVPASDPSPAGGSLPLRTWVPYLSGPLVGHSLTIGGMVAPVADFSLRIPQPQSKSSSTGGYTRVRYLLTLDPRVS